MVCTIISISSSVCSCCRILLAFTPPLSLPSVAQTTSPLCRAFHFHFHWAPMCRVCRRLVTTRARLVSLHTLCFVTQPNTLDKSSTSFPHRIANAAASRLPFSVCHSSRFTMPGTKKTTPPCPAQWVGGQRRRLIRRNRSNAGPPRSSTMPMLSSDSAAASLVSSISSAGSNYVKDRQSEDSFDLHRHNTLQELEVPEDTMQFYPPSGAVK